MRVLTFCKVLIWMRSCRIRRNTSKSSLGALARAMFPHARRRNFAASVSIANGDIARGWVADQIEQNAMDDELAQALNLSKIATTFALPLYIPMPGRKNGLISASDQRTADGAQCLVRCRARSGTEILSPEAFILPIDCWKKPGTGSSSRSASEAPDPPG